MADPITDISAQLMTFSMSGSSVYVIIGVLILIVGGVYFWFKMKNKDLPLINRPSLKAFIFEECTKGFIAKIDDVVVKENPDTLKKEYWFVKEKTFYPPHCFGHITANNWLTCVKLNRNELYPAPLVIQDGKVRDENGNWIVVTYGKLQPMVDETLNQQFALKMQQIYTEHKKVAGWMELLEKYGLIMIVAIACVLIIYVTVTQLTPLMDSIGKYTESNKAVAQALINLFNNTRVAQPTGAPPPY